MEHRLATLAYCDTRGDSRVAWINDDRWKRALLPLLVDWKAALAVTGGQAACSPRCSDEDLVGY